MKVNESVFELLKNIARVAYPLNLFLLFCEVFKEFYTDSAHVASAQYLFTGLHGHNLLVPFIWSAIAFGVWTTYVFLSPKHSNNYKVLIPTCAIGFVGIWIEKGMGLIIPGFVPSPLGTIVEYTPSVGEFFVCLGIWATGALVFTLMAKAALDILSGQLRINS